VRTALQLQVVDDPAAADLSAEQLVLSVGAFTALGLAIPGDIGRPDARPHFMLDDEATLAAFTVAAVIPGADPGEAIIKQTVSTDRVKSLDRQR
jgi:hypothetical protein